MKYLKFFILLLSIVSCSSDKSLDKLNNHSPVLAFGDSLTAGVGASESDAYPNQLEKLIGMKGH